MGDTQVTETQETDLFADDTDEYFIREVQDRRQLWDSSMPKKERPNNLCNILWAEVASKFRSNFMIFQNIYRP